MLLPHAAKGIAAEAGSYRCGAKGIAAEAGSYRCGAKGIAAKAGSCSRGAKSLAPAAASMRRRSLLRTVEIVFEDDVERAVFGAAGFAAGLDADVVDGPAVTGHEHVAVQAEADLHRSRVVGRGRQRDRVRLPRGAAVAGGQHAPGRATVGAGFDVAVVVAGFGCAAVIERQRGLRVAAQVEHRRGQAAAEVVAVVRRVPHLGRIAGYAARDDPWRLRGPARRTGFHVVVEQGAFRQQVEVMLHLVAGLQRDARNVLGEIVWRADLRVVG